MGAVVLFKSFYLYSVVVAVSGILLGMLYIKNVNRVPVEYRHFYVTKEALKYGATGMTGFTIFAVFIFLPNLKMQLPFTINNLEKYFYFNLFLCGMMVFMAAKEDIKLPEKIGNWIKENDDVITMDMVDGLIDTLNGEEENTKDLDEISNTVYKTLADFVSIGVLEMDDDNECFRKK